MVLLYCCCGYCCCCCCGCRMTRGHEAHGWALVDHEAWCQRGAGLRGQQQRAALGERG